VEVKSPLVPTPSSTWTGDDRKVILKNVEKAAKQLVPGECNIVVLCAMLRSPVYTERDQLIALFGDRVLAFTVDVKTGAGGPPSTEWKSSGKLVRTKPASQETFSSRVGAILVIELSSHTQPKPKGLVAYNPFAECEVPRRWFSRLPTWDRLEGDYWGWSDYYAGTGSKG
jgi:hypothetical protein